MRVHARDLVADATHIAARLAERVADRRRDRQSGPASSTARAPASTSRISRIPARGGRYSGSRGYLEAAQYVADQFKAIGLEGLGDGGTFLQRFTMPIVDLSATPALSRTGADAKSWKHRVDFTETVGGRSGNGTVEAPVVVVGGGAKGNGQDDFAGASTRGRIALVTGPDLRHRGRDHRSPKARSASWWSATCRSATRTSRASSPR